MKVLMWVGIGICIVLAIAVWATVLNKEQIKLESAKIERHIVQLRLENEQRQHDIIKVELEYKQLLLDMLTKGVDQHVNNIKTMTGPRRTEEEIKADIESGHTLKGDE